MVKKRIPIKVIRKKFNAPHTNRFCIICGKKTQFEYNKNIFHSECIECGGRIYKN